jgi:hypothetical protein
MGMSFLIALSKKYYGTFCPINNQSFVKKAIFLD